jgi:hypothetical protein
MTAVKIGALMMYVYWRFSRRMFGSAGHSTKACQSPKARLVHVVVLLCACRYLQLKAAAPEHYQHRLLVRAFTAWRDRTEAKQHAEQQRQLAVRHRYRCTLGKVLQAWQEAVKTAGHKQQVSATAQQHFEHKLLTAVVRVSNCCSDGCSTITAPGSAYCTDPQPPSAMLVARARQACPRITHTTLC